MAIHDDDLDARLRLSAQRALWGHVPPSLRAVSLEIRGSVIVFRAVFEPAATKDDRNLLSIAATEVIADFPGPATIEEEFLEVALPTKPSHLRNLVFLRAEAHDANAG